MAVEPIFVHCMRAGKIIATYEFGWAVGMVRSAPPERDGLISQAKAQLTTDRLAFPPYEDVTFEVRYPVGTDLGIEADIGQDHEGEPSGDSVGNDLGSGGFGQAFGSGFGRGDYVAGTYGSGDYGAGDYGSGALGTEVLGTTPLGSLSALPGRARPGGAMPNANGADGIAATAGLAAGEAYVTGAAVVIPAIWSQHGSKVLAQIEQVDKNLAAFRAFAVSLEDAKFAIKRGHNNPPDLVDAPEIDVEALDAAIAALQELRVQVINPNPDQRSLDLIWRTLALGARACGKFASWVAEMGAKKATQYLDNVFDSATKAFGSSLGTPQGIAAWYVVGCGIAGDHHKQLMVLVEVVKGVSAALTR